MFRLFTVALMLLLTFCPNALALDKVLVLYVSDGDTLHVSVAGKDRRLRLIGVDTPESSINNKSSKQSHHSERKMETILSLGERAKHYMKTLVHRGDVVSVEYDVGREDKYNRLLAYVYLANGTMHNEKLIRDGYAKPMTVPPNVRYAKKFVKLYGEARKYRFGLWAD
jgi:micrococcal nuclease